MEGLLLGYSKLILSLQLTATPDVAPSSHQPPSPEQAAFTPQVRNATAADPAPSPESEPAKATSDDTTASTGVVETVSTAAATVKDAVPTSYEELKAQLAQAQATIASYSQDAGVRMRKAVSATSEAASQQTSALATTTGQVTTEGVPVQIVAALCLLSFLLAYLFF